MIASDDFPRLTRENHRITSPADPEYNCIAWSVGDTTRWYQPGRFWPIPASADDAGLGVLEQMFLAMGYRDCGCDDSLEPGFEKVALYGYGLYYTHAARQLPSGKWTSKLGPQQDIEHDTPHDVSGPAYGEVAQVMKRPIQ
jgi:hypothetical protein